jgi:hypothetical protein
MANTKVTSRVLANDAVLTANIADDQVTTAKIADDQITSALVADDLALGGNPTTTTQSAGNNTTRIATTAFVTTAVANIVDSAPSALDTLNELAAALGDDANFSTTITNSIATKAPLASPTFTGDVDIDATDDLRLRFLNGGTFKAGIQVPTSTGDMISGAAVDDLAIRSQANMLFSTGGNTERLRIDDTGRVGIGMTPSDHSGYMLQMTGGSQSFIAIGNNTTGTGALNGLIVGNDSSGADIYQRENQPLRLHTNNIERMRIDSSGRVGINRTPAIANSKLEVGGADNVPLINVEASGNTAGFGIGSGNLSFFNGTSAVGTIALSTGTLQMTAGATSAPTYSFVGDTTTGMSRPTGSAINFVSGGTEVARFRSGGLSIGTGDALDANLTVYATHTNDNVGIASFRSLGDDESACCVSIVKAANSTSTSQIYIKFGINNYNSGGGMITASGSTGAFGSFSDSRLKENISDLSSQLPNILALRPVNFDYKDAFNGGKDQIGFIAQEVEKVYPDLVGENDGYKITSGLNKMEARLIKAIQEQQEQIETLKKEVEELKGG